jgi:hypothetical protein
MNLETTSTTEFIRRINEHFEEEDRKKKEEARRPKTLAELAAELPGARAELDLRSDEAWNAAQAWEATKVTRDERQRAFDRRDDHESRSALQAAAAEVSAGELSIGRAGRLKASATKRVQEIEAAMAEFGRREEDAEAKAARERQASEAGAEILSSIVALVSASRRYKAAMNLQQAHGLAELLSNHFCSALAAVDGREVGDRLAGAIFHPQWPTSQGTSSPLPRL